MPAAKLKVDAATFKKLPAACQIADVTIKDQYKVTDKIHVELSASTTEKYVELGQILATISPEDIKAFEDRQKSKADKKAAKAATA